MSKFAVTDKGILGVFHIGPLGIRFIPWVQHSPSRKLWQTVEAATPRWAKGCKVIDAQTPESAMKQYAEQKDTPLAGRVCALSYKFGYDSPEARTLTEAAEKLRER